MADNEALHPNGYLAIAEPQRASVGRGFRAQLHRG